VKVEGTGGNLTVIRGWESRAACSCNSLMAICADVCGEGGCTNVGRPPAKQVRPAGSSEIS